MRQSEKRDFGLDARSMEEFVHFLMETGWLETMEADLASMDHEKLGRPFAFTDRAIQWANRLRIVFKTSYRLARGLMNHFLRGLGFQGISLTQFYDRCRRASAVGGADGRVLVSGPCDVDVSETPISVAVDSTGMSLNKYGGWRCCHWNLKSVTGWIKLHAAADTDTNRILAYAVTDERCGDVNLLRPLVEDVISAGHKVGKILVDAAYDKKDYWNEYATRGIDVAINIRNSQLNKYNYALGSRPLHRTSARVLHRDDLGDQPEVREDVHVLPGESDEPPFAVDPDLLGALQDLHALAIAQVLQRGCGIEPLHDPAAHDRGQETDEFGGDDRVVGMHPGPVEPVDVLVVPEDCLDYPSLIHDSISHFIAFSILGVVPLPSLYISPRRFLLH